MLLFTIGCLLGLSLVGLAYFLRGRKLIRNETARKLVHFAHALVVAGWPVFIGYWFVIVGELVFLTAVLIAQEYRLFHQLRQINRKTWGEFFFPLGVIVLAVIAPPTWIFVSALLLLGLADGAAALVGKRLKSKQYKIFGHKKTVAGSLAFFGVSVVVMAAVLLTSQTGLSGQRFWLVVLLIPFITTIPENLSPYGSDNLTVPIIVYVSLAGLGLAS